MTLTLYTCPRQVSTALQCPQRRPRFRRGLRGGHWAAPSGAGCRRAPLSAASTRSKTVTAVTNCELVFLPQREARKLVQELPAFKSRLLQFQASRASRDALKTLASGQVRLPFIFAGRFD